MVNFFLCTPLFHIQLGFDACIQEQEGTNLKIFPKLFTCLRQGYFYTQLVVYFITVIIIGIPMTIVWGCLSGTAMFGRIWIWVPILKLILFWMYSCSPIMTRPVQFLCVPLVDVCARRYRQIRIQTTLNGQEKTPFLIKNV